MDTQSEVLIMLVRARRMRRAERYYCSPQGCLKEKKVDVWAWWGSRRKSREPRHGKVSFKNRRGLTQQWASVLWCFQLKGFNEAACLPSFTA